MTQSCLGGLVSGTLWRRSVESWRGCRLSLYAFLQKLTLTTLNAMLVLTFFILLSKCVGKVSVAFLNSAQSPEDRTATASAPAPEGGHT